MDHRLTVREKQEISKVYGTTHQGMLRINFFLCIFIFVLFLVFSLLGQIAIDLLGNFLFLHHMRNLTFVVLFC